MKEDLYDDLYLEEKEEKTDFKAILFKYAIHWPWFVACTLLCIAGAWLYLRYTPPVYNISASVIIKDNDKNSKASSGMADLEDLGFYSSINNFDNEMEILQSRTLIKKVVEELDLYISYATKSSFHDIELYKSSPVKVWITPEEAQKLPAPARLHLTLQPGNKLNVKLRIGEEEYNKQFDKLLELMDIVDEGYFEDYDKQSLLDGAADGLLSGLGDPYTFYYTPEEYAKLWEDDEGEYAGVGIQISTSYLTGICTISRVFDNGPAHEAGVRKGDILYKVEDLYVNSSTINDAVDIMRGTPGTDVHVTFLRGTEEMAYTLTRANINVNRIDSMMLTDEIGYIYLYDFAGDCAEKFETTVNKMVENGTKGLIIDLRDNPGGWVNDAQSIADIFLDKGTLCYLQYKNGERYYYRTKDGKVEIQLVILVNENSASSSEILTGALRDRANATVVGKKTYGKGIVQSVVPLSDGSGMQITVAQYYTPNGYAVHKQGITPDVEVDGDNGMYELGDLTDAQLAKALEVMQEKLAQTK